METVHLRVPATTANLGPGFDCLGLALDLFNELEVAPSPELSVWVLGEGVGQIRLDQQHLVYRAIVSVFERTGQTMPPVQLRCLNRIPLARGLGSSAAAVAGGLVVANEWLNQPLSWDDLFQMGVEIEGHADNIGPALFGGCQLVFPEAGRYRHVPIPVPPDLKAVLFIPDLPLSTAQSRGVLPALVPRSDAVFNLGRVSLLVLALATGQLELLPLATQDSLHQPARQALFPAMESLFQAAREAGALGACLSGSGSAVLALTRGDSRAQDIGQAMQQAAVQAGIRGQALTVAPTLQGTHRVE